jgi:hypothetical protein
MAETISLTLALHNDNGASLAVSQFGDHAKVVFLPYSQIEFRELRGKFVKSTKGLKLQLIECDVPVWLAEKRELV